MTCDVLHFWSSLFVMTPGYLNDLDRFEMFDRRSDFLGARGEVLLHRQAHSLLRLGLTSKGHDFGGSGYCAALLGLAGCTGTVSARGGLARSIRRVPKVNPQITASSRKVRQCHFAE